MKLVRRVLRVLGVTYVVCFLFSAVNFPQTFSSGLSHFSPGVLLMPMATIGTGRAYGQFLQNATWPFGNRKDIVILDELIDAQGQSFIASLKGVTFDSFPQAGRYGNQFDITLGKEVYGQGATLGFVLRVGRFFCLMDTSSNMAKKLLGPSRCYEILLRPPRHYYWRALGEDREQPVRIISHKIWWY